MKKKRWTLKIRFAATAVVATLGQSAVAGGFYVSELGTPGSLGTAGASNVTNNFTADAAFTNPAAMTGIKNDHALAGMQVIVPAG